jgi:SAM-dependent methyltransferase
MVNMNANFNGSIPEYYDACLGPAWFDAFAVDLARRLPSKPGGDVLEIGCGTGLLTRRLRERLVPDVRLVATDLSGAMLDCARDKLGDLKGIEWREADAGALPFGVAEFDAVVCGFGLMFVPDRQAALRQVHRVLKAGGLFLFNVWDAIERNPHAAAASAVLAELFAGDEQMRFDTPYEMHDPALLRRLLAGAQFGDVKIETKRLQLDRVSARTLATGQIRGSPRSLLVEQRGVAVDEVVDRLTDALVKIGGADPYRGPAQAVVVEARRSARA